MNAGSPGVCRIETHASSYAPPGHQDIFPGGLSHVLTGQRASDVGRPDGVAGKVR